MLFTTAPTSVCLPARHERGLVLGAFDWNSMCIDVRGGVVDKTHGTHKSLHIYLFLQREFGPIYYTPP